MTKFRRELSSLLFGGLGFTGAFALVFISSAPDAEAAKDDLAPSWKVARCVLEPGLYVCEITLSLVDDGDFGSSQCEAKSSSVADICRLPGASGDLVTADEQLAPVPTLTRLAPKRSPPPAPRFA